jgi:hypothetical protein
VGFFNSCVDVQRAGSRRATNLHILRPLQANLRVEDVEGRTPDNLDLHVIGKHRDRLDHILDYDVALAVLSGLPQGLRCVENRVLAL